MANELGIGLSPITQKIYVGRQNKAKRMWVGEKKDITDNFLDVMFQYLELDEVREISTETEGKITTHLFIHAKCDKDSLQNSIDFLQKKLSKLK